MKHAWKDKVIVITGASSDIGRATALALAKKGAHLVLADVTESAAVRALATQAVHAFGRIDGWVNNAGVYLVGRLEETPDDAFRQVMETNFFGTVYGSRAALAQFRHQGRGILVNVSSVYGSTAGPYVSAYAASKFAVRGFSASIRQEFEGTGIHVCTVMPAAVDTPLWQHSANYTGWRVRPVEPIYSPERVAHAIVRVLAKPRRELFISPSRRAFPFQPMASGTGQSAGHRSPARQWFKRLLLAGGLVATVTSLRRTAAARRLGHRVVHALGA